MCTVRARYSSRKLDLMKYREKHERNPFEKQWNFAKRTMYVKTERIFIVFSEPFMNVFHLKRNAHDVYPNESKWGFLPFFFSLMMMKHFTHRHQFVFWKNICLFTEQAFLTTVSSKKDYFKIISFRYSNFNYSDLSCSKSIGYAIVFYEAGWVAHRQANLHFIKYLITFV